MRPPAAAKIQTLLPETCVWTSTFADPASVRPATWLSSTLSLSCNLPCSTTASPKLDQRFYNINNGFSRFMTADPDARSISISDSATWNRYTYVLNDPVNGIDPTGLITCGDIPVSIGGRLAGTVSTYLNARSDAGKLTRFVWAEGGSLSANGGSQGALGLSDALIAQAVVIRINVANGRVAVQGADDNVYWSVGGDGRLRATSLGYGGIGTTLSQELVRAAAGTGEVNSRGELNDRSGINDSLDIELGDATRSLPGRVPEQLTNGSTYYVTPECDRLIQALQSTNYILSGGSLNAPGFFVTSWKANGNSNPDPSRLYTLGIVGGTTFYGFASYGFLPKPTAP